MVYRARLLEERAEVDHMSEQKKWVLDRFEYKGRTYPGFQCPSWEHEVAKREVNDARSIQFLNDLREIWSTTTIYFRDLENKSSPFWYIDLVEAHIAQAVYYPDLAEANIKGKTNRVYDHRYDRTVIEGMRTCVGNIKARRRVAEGMHIYADQIPKVVDFMKEKRFGNAMLVREAWWTLILRASAGIEALLSWRFHKAIWFLRVTMEAGYPCTLRETRFSYFSFAWMNLDLRYFNRTHSLVWYWYHSDTVCAF